MLLWWLLNLSKLFTYFKGKSKAKAKAKKSKANKARGKEKNIL